MRYSDSNYHTIGDGPHRGWDLKVHWLDGGVAAHDDRLQLSLWAPDADDASHEYLCYRHGYGWDVMRAALDGADTRMDELHQWWLQRHGTLVYAAHRTLYVLHELSGATRAVLGAALRLDRPSCAYPAPPVRRRTLRAGRTEAGRRGPR